ncbi:MAG: alpha/beta hydrolase [Pseudomonadota bacterium]
MHTQTLQLNGKAFFVRSWGETTRAPLLMLHGFPEFGGAWEELAEKMGDRFHAIAPDQRGYGQSWSPEGVEKYRLSHLVADMAALVDQIGAPVRVLGHDWGAAVAYGLAMTHPDKVSRLAIVNGVHPVPFQRALARGGAQTDASQYITALRREGSEDRLSANGYEKLFSAFSARMDMSWMTPARRADYLAAWSAGGGRLGTMINWYRASPLVVGPPATPIKDLPEFPLDRMQIRCPHLLVWGMNDTALLPEATEGLEDFAADLTRVTIDDADHWVVHQRPDRVAQILRDWL